MFTRHAAGHVTHRYYAGHVISRTVLHQLEKVRIRAREKWREEPMAVLLMAIRVPAATGYSSTWSSGSPGERAHMQVAAEVLAGRCYRCRRVTAVAMVTCSCQISPISLTTNGATYCHLAQYAYTYT